jgi:hypothetical protein
VSSPSAIREALKKGPIALLIAATTVFLAACNQVGTDHITFWDIVYSMVFFFFLFLAIWIFIAIFSDIFRRNDLSGGWKVIWIIVIFWIPFIGILAYILMRPKVTAQDVQMMAAAEASQKAVTGVSKADELAKLQALKDAGTINDAQFEDLKAKLMAS